MNNPSGPASSKNADIGTLWAPGAARRAGIAEARWQALLAALPTAADNIWHRRASQVSEADLDAYVSLQWMRWNGGSIELTDIGRNLIRVVDGYQGN